MSVIQDKSKLRSFRLPSELSKRLDDRARLESKTVTDLVVAALENLLSAPSASIEESRIMRLNRQVRELEVEVERLEKEDGYTTAKRELRIIGLKENDELRGIGWCKGSGESFEYTTRDKAERGVYHLDGKRYSITVGEYEGMVADKAVNEKILADYDHRIHELKDKIAELKAEIVHEPLTL